MVDMDDPRTSGLQKCCAVISGLRDTILAIEAAGGAPSPDLQDALASQFVVARQGHDFDDKRFSTWKTLRSLIEQAGRSWPTYPRELCRLTKGGAP